MTIPWKFRDDISSGSGVIVLSIDKQTNTQTYTTENNFTLAVQVVNISVRKFKKNARINLICAPSIKHSCFFSVVLHTNTHTWTRNAQYTLPTPTQRDATVELSRVGRSAACTEFATSWRQFRRVWINLPPPSRVASWRRCERTRRRRRRRRRRDSTRQLRRVVGVGGVNWT